MFDKIKAIFTDPAGPARGEGIRFDPLQHAVAALLVEAARMDDHFDADEHATVARHLRERFELDEATAEHLVETAEAEADRAVEVYSFTRTVKDNVDHDERVAILQMLWEVAYSDGELHDYEANLMRRLTGLLHVSDQENGQARKAALARLGLTG
ncbi:Uncharacterized conserved protein, tellurite resistance protein B (TerB) family [Limimonas halophila]|uniref:Uncharacterized conserved protein, tellurite resistance protein B (TerB) family n=1 Tax=Limimonas halophila TaxID=1082479 RepID=A0A1G7RKZ1_9PROT|nr:TerB family tellurite resistance protein [Limimonas halophila]SDG10879.1 Uncharacterized conserved protein, tellurite resistance protein B (TerB) family [Limimonas halophila]